MSDKSRLDFPKVNSAIRVDIESLREKQSELSVLSENAAGPRDYTAALGMPVEDALTVWRSKGAPVIHVPDGNIFDLAKFLAEPGAPESHLEAVRTWLEKHTGGNGQC